MAKICVECERESKLPGTSSEALVWGGGKMGAKGVICREDRGQEWASQYRWHEDTKNDRADGHGREHASKDETIREIVRGVWDEDGS